MDAQKQKQFERGGGKFFGATALFYLGSRDDDELVQRVNVCINFGKER